MSGRLYRVSWALVALPLLIAAFTVVRPAPLAKPELPPSFDGPTAARLADQLALTYPDRTPGTEEAAGAADWVAERLAEYNLSVTRQDFTADIPDLGAVRLTNVIASPLRIGPERSPETIVIVAHRDNSGLSPGANDNASGTAALIELARNLSTLTLSHTVVFVSTDAGSFGNHGAARLAASPEFRRDILAVVNLDSLAGPGPPRLIFSGDEPRSPAGVLLTTAEASIEAETGAVPQHASPPLQLADLAFPFGLHDQTPFLGQRVSAVTLTTTGDEPAAGDDEAFDTELLGASGRAAQALVVSLDGAAEVAQGTDSFLYLGGRFIRGFAIQLVLLVAVVPVLVAVADLYARLRRRAIVVRPALRSYAVRLAVWLWVGLVAAVFTLAGLFPNGDPRPLSPLAPSARDWPFWALAGLALLGAAAWFLARTRLIPRATVERGDELAGHFAAMLALIVVAVVVAVDNAYTLLLFLPSLHVWLFAPNFRSRSATTRAVVFVLGLAGPALLLACFAVRLGLGLDSLLYVGTLFSVGYASVVLLVALLAWAAAAGQIGAMLFGRYAPYPGRSPGSPALEERPG